MHRAVSCFHCGQRGQEDSVQSRVSGDLLREARNVISGVSVYSAWAVNPFQPFVPPTVIPVNRTESRRLPVLWTHSNIAHCSLCCYTKTHQCLCVQSIASRVTPSSSRTAWKITNAVTTFNYHIKDNLRNTVFRSLWSCRTLQSIDTVQQWQFCSWDCNGCFWECNNVDISPLAALQRCGKPTSFNWIWKQSFISRRSRNYYNCLRQCVQQTWMCNCRGSA